MTDDVIELVAADPREAAEIAALVKLAYRGDGSRSGWTTEADLLADERIDEQGVRDKIGAPGSLVLVLRRDGELIACCELARRDDERAYFGMFAVRPGLQAAGLGRRILNGAETLARTRWGVRTMEMTVIGQRSELIAWYERRGYRLTGERRPFDYGALVNGPALRDDLYFVVLAKSLTA